MADQPNSQPGSSKKQRTDPVDWDEPEIDMAAADRNLKAMEKRNPAFKKAQVAREKKFQKLKQQSS